MPSTPWHYPHQRPICINIFHLLKIKNDLVGRLEMPKYSVLSLLYYKLDDYTRTFVILVTKTQSHQHSPLIMCDVCQRFLTPHHAHIHKQGICVTAKTLDLPGRKRPRKTGGTRVDALGGRRSSHKIKLPSPRAPFTGWEEERKAHQPGKTR